MKKRLFLVIITMVGAFGWVAAQPANSSACSPAPTNCEANWCWGENPGKTKETYTIFSDALKLKEYGRAIEPYEWLLANVPCLNESGIYVNGIKLYEALAEEEKDASKKIQYQEKVLTLYDKRLAIYGDKLDVMERKALKFYPYELIERTNVSAPDAGMVNKLFAFYEKTVEMGGANLKQAQIFAYYMDLMCKKKNIVKDINEEVILDKYGKIVQIIDAKIAEGKNKDIWEETKVSIDGMLENCVTLGCDFITNKLYPKLQANPNDIDMAKKIVAFILKIKDETDKSKCYKGEIFTKSVEVIYSKEKTSSIAEILANRALANGDEEGYLKYINEAIESEADPAKKAENIYRVAGIMRKQGKLGEARSLYIKSATTDASYNSKAYGAIGDMYMSSYNQCKSGDAVQSRVVFLAAYDMYAKAGDNSGMANARQQFPSITDAFTLGKKEGESMSIGCWIGGSTTLRLRPKQ
jgi:hypothetical protein